MLTFTYTTHADAPKGRTMKTSKAQGDFTPAEWTQFETEAATVEGQLQRSEQLWTIDSLNIGIPPRGKRPVERPE